LVKPAFGFQVVVITNKQAAFRLNLRKTAMAKRVTRAFDVGISTALLLITLPVIVFTAILVWLESPGRIFERQRRISKAGRPFALLRFRTLSIAPEPHVASEKPARYTRVGAVIHRLYIDELPQLLNILRGEMGFERGPGRDESGRKRYFRMTAKGRKLPNRMEA
jgi:lipopolysaccharide/colanic/teichoic acid biosynthesis glycosyltransferase